jgi:ubiquinone/menaquinone biosynthesis C-methylase UbiE
MKLFRPRRSPESMKRLYDWFHRYYGSIERSMEPTLDEVLRIKVASMEDLGTMTALDYACGSGAWTLRLARHFRAVAGRDQSRGMLSRAQERARQLRVAAEFREGSILDIDEEESSVDWAFVSFALHLFPPSTGVEILRNLMRVARQGVMVVDHSRKWALGVAIAEWLEGSHYDQFVRTDFAAVASEVGAHSFEEVTIGDAMVLTFGKAVAGAERPATVT